MTSGRDINDVSIHFSGTMNKTNGYIEMVHLTFLSPKLHTQGRTKNWNLLLKKYHDDIL